MKLLITSFICLFISFVACDVGELAGARVARGLLKKDKQQAVPLPEYVDNSQIIPNYPPAGGHRPSPADNSQLIPNYPPAGGHRPAPQVIPDYSVSGGHHVVYRSVDNVGEPSEEDVVEVEIGSSTDESVVPISAQEQVESVTAEIQEPADLPFANTIGTLAVDHPDYESPYHYKKPIINLDYVPPVTLTKVDEPELNLDYVPPVPQIKIEKPELNLDYLGPAIKAALPEEPIAVEQIV